MQIKKLTPGQRFIVDGMHELEAQFMVSTSNDAEFEFSAPNVDSRRRGDNIAVRHLAGATEIILTPIERAFPSQTTVFVSLILLAEQRKNEVQLDFPPFDVANLSSFTLGVLSMTPQGLVIDVADLADDVGLDRAASEIRSVARSTIGGDTMPAMQKRDVTIVLDVSASMGRSLQPEQLQAMCQFASGVLAVAAAGHTVRFTTSSQDSPTHVVESGETEVLCHRDFGFNDAGWGFDLSTIAEDEALVIISDDIPAAVMGRRFVHVLTPRQPLSLDCTCTVFHQDFVHAVQQSRTALLERDTEIMLNTLMKGA